MNRIDQLRTVIFDLDGTLFDTLPSLSMAANQVLTAAGLQPLPPEALRGALSQGLLPMFRKALAMQSRALPAVTAAQLEAECALHYARNWLAAARPYPTARECLAALQADGLRLAICTNRDRASTDVLLGFFEAIQFEAIVALGDAALPKPAPDPLIEVLRQLQLRPSDALFVGDSLMDSQCAKAAAVDFAAHLGGYANDTAELQPHVIAFNDYDELTRCVRQHRAIKEALYA